MSYCSTNCSCDKPQASFRCGGRYIWSGVSCCLAITGIVLIAVVVVVGGCECAGDSPCDLLARGGGECRNFFDGCTKGSYDDAECQRLVITGTLTNACAQDACKYGGMDAGIAMMLLIVGILCLIICCIFCCGICPCLCFFNPDAPMEAATAAEPVTAAPAVEMKLEEGVLPPKDEESVSEPAPVAPEAPEAPEAPAAPAAPEEATPQEARNCC